MDEAGECSRARGLFDCGRATERHGGKLVLVNVTSSGFSTSVQLGHSYGSGNTVALTAPSLTSTTGITFGGHFVGKGGTFAGTAPTPLSVSGSSLTLNLPANSATVVTLDP